jgi:hypothetical protein
MSDRFLIRYQWRMKKEKFFKLISSRRNHPRQQICLCKRKNTNQYSQRQAVQEDKAKDSAFASGLTRGCGGNYDTLSVDHLAHYSARAVRGHDQ